MKVTGEKCWMVIEEVVEVEAGDLCRQCLMKYVNWREMP